MTDCFFDEHDDRVIIYTIDEDNCSHRPVIIIDTAPDSKPTDCYLFRSLDSGTQMDMRHFIKDTAHDIKIEFNTKELLTRQEQLFGDWIKDIEILKNLTEIEGQEPVIVRISTYNCEMKCSTLRSLRRFRYRDSKPPYQAIIDDLWESLDRLYEKLEKLKSRSKKASVDIK